jgi:hypothetical protein
MREWLRAQDKMDRSHVCLILVNLWAQIGSQCFQQKQSKYMENQGTRIFWPVANKREGDK